MDGIEREMDGETTVVRVNIQSDVGRAVRERYQVGYVPAFIVVDGQGRETWRHQGFPDRGEVLRQLRAARADAPESP